MHSPGICGVILAAGSQPGTGSASSSSKAEALSGLITALNTDTDMILVALGTNSETLEPVAWAQAAYVVQLPPKANDAETLRTMLQEVLNHGRDAALVTALDDQDLTAETVHRMVATYCSAGDETWAVTPENATQKWHPVLLGRQMIELFLRGQKWNSADEVLSANTAHVSAMKAENSKPAPAAPMQEIDAPRT
jgi:CTP:molybdopterin cytidylyltransferase MocA